MVRLSLQLSRSSRTEVWIPIGRSGNLGFDEMEAATRDLGNASGNLNILPIASRYQDFEETTALISMLDI